MSERRGSAPTARLVDMEVQEVSLVDRAANKRKFLVVKRSEGMGQESNPGSTGEGTEGEEGHEGEDGSAGDDEGGGEESPLEVATSAFDGVTSAMARLQSAGADALRGELENVVEELRGAADALEGQLAGDDSDHEDEADDEQDSAQDVDSKSPLAPLLGAMTELVAEMRAARTGKPVAKAGRKGGKAVPARGGAGSGRGGDEDEADDVESDEDDEDEAPPVRRGSPPKSTPKRKSAGAGAGQAQGLQADMRALRSDLKTFSTSIAEHARRLSKLEKRSAPPSSRPAGERPGASRINGDAWPLDLNAPRSR
jgi:hypothetical protein